MTTKRVIVAVLLMSSAFGAAEITYLRYRRSDAAKRHLSEFCRDKGGNITFDLVDGDIILDLDGAHISRQEAEMMRTAFAACLSSDLPGKCRIHLNLNGTEIDGDITSILNDQVRGLAVAKLRIDDDQLGTIIACSPRIEELNLDETLITDAAIPHIASLPIKVLSVRNTRVSAESLHLLRHCRALYRLVASISDEEAREMRAVLPGCDVEN